MKKILFCTVLCILMWNQGYSADRTTKQYNFKDFKKVEISNGIQFNISQASSYSIVINADTQDFEYLKVEKERSTLRIYIDKNNYRKAGDIDIKIQMPELTGLDLSGGSNGEFTMNIKDNFSCEFSGGAQVNGNLSCQNANMGSTDFSGGSGISQGK